MIQQLRQKTEEVRQYATSYWHYSKRANQLYEDFEKIKNKEQGQAHKDAILKE